MWQSRHPSPHSPQKLTVPFVPFHCAALESWLSPVPDADILLPSRCGGSPLDAVATLLVTRHQRDRVLRLYPHLNRGPSPRAMGLAGVSRPWLLGPHHQRLEVMDLTRCIRGRHDFLNYLSAAPLAARIADRVQW